MSRALKFLMFIYFVVFLTTGTFMVLIVNADESSPTWITLLVRNHSIVYAWHLVCWMILGMFTNYYWDLFNMGKGIESMQVLRIVLPLLVSPFVFMPTYNLWLASSSQSYMLFAVIAIQSGFFWQALLAKVAPLDKPTSIPWSVNNGASRANRATAPVTPELG
ncbi:hypothetical protein [uncultured Rhodoferax sp.]|uniref:hypothetical protein n=1 Tax=uncultured Rhodoferax sp. TaxID=223188 RepID=UPI0025DE6355|nr:hypothetical protein [uncultured Rhodoferax sp.]